MTTLKPEHNRESGASCTSCDVGRRMFLRDAATAVALLAVAGTPAAALPVRFIESLGRAGKEVTYPIPAADGVNVDKDNDAFIVRTAGKVFVMAVTCPHQNSALKWLDGDRRFQCPKHKSKYTAEGVFIEGRATRSMDRFAVRKAGTTVVADLDKLYEEDQDGAKWKEAFIPA
ncbi:MAG: Rieske 2Fe-2S domain-containing protein [Gemmatimonadetes bacterium]|nr:Rieske 2Fe-2S domain-containing protein [Gemmatimonadota bacterium]